MVLYYKNSMKKVHLTILITPEEKEKLKLYCEQTGRNPTEVVRDFIRRIRLKE